MRNYLFLLLLTWLLTTVSYAQSSLYLQHRLKSQREIPIKQKRDYIFYTSDSTFYGQRIVSFEENTLILLDKNRLTSRKLTFTEVNYLEKERKVGFFEGTAYTAMILLSITPVVWAFEGGQEALNTLEGVAVLAVISVPVLLVKNIGRKKDTQNKWAIKFRS